MGCSDRCSRRARDCRAGIPNSLSPAASALSAAGQSGNAAVRALDDECGRMPEARAWSGQLHKAATEMFGRATNKTSEFAHYTEVVATALEKGSGSICRCRRTCSTRRSTDCWSRSATPTTEPRKICRPLPRTSATPFTGRVILEAWIRTRAWLDRLTKSPIRCHKKGSSSRVCDPGGAQHWTR